MLDVPSATRANLPSRYDFSLVRDPPPNTPTESAPYKFCARRNSLTILLKTASQLAGASVPSPPRISGASSLSGCFSVDAAVQPLMHSAPLFTGNVSSPMIAVSSPRAPSITIPH